MSRLTPPAVDVPRTNSDDPRVGHLLGRSCSSGSAEVVLIGFPSDEGVRINGGRPGAAEAPQLIREHLYRMAPDARAPERFRHMLERTADLGDVEVTGDVERDQERLGRILKPYLAREAVPIILGGGHETAFGHFLGYVYSGKSVEIMNWDAHPDVRILDEGRGHSGSPFRQSVLHESGSCTRYSVLGLSSHQTSYAHLEFVTSTGGDVVWGDELSEQRIREACTSARRPLMVSFDLDAVDQSQAPGVSAPATAGMSSALWLMAAYESGRCSMASSFDLVELNPRFDIDGRTARLAALTVWSILRGLSERTTQQQDIRSSRSA